MSDTPDVANSPLSPVPRRRYALFFAVVAVGTAADLISKELVFDWLGPPGADRDNTWWLVEGYIGIQTSVNQGALFGMGQGKSGYFAAFSVFAVVWIVYYLFVRRNAHHTFLTFAIACVTGGILGNLYDRLGLWHAADAPAHFQHGVRDWILFRYGDFTWPNFNIADSLLVCGAGMLVWITIFDAPEPPNQKKENGAQQK